MHLSDAFPHLDENEKAVLTLRKHPIVMLSVALKGIGLLFLPPIAYGVLSASVPEFFNFTDGSPTPYFIVLGVSLYYLYLWLFLYVHWLEYYLDVWIVTSERVINIDQRRLFSRRISEMRLAQVQDCTTEVEGMLHTFFRFGDIDLQTAAKENKFTFKNIPRPDDVQGIILKLMKENQQGRGVSTSPPMTASNTAPLSETKGAEQR